MAAFKQLYFWMTPYWIKHAAFLPISILQMILTNYYYCSYSIGVHAVYYKFGIKSKQFDFNCNFSETTCTIKFEENWRERRQKMLNVRNTV